MAMPQERIYTSEDYWNLPDGQRAELIDGKLYVMARQIIFIRQLLPAFITICKLRYLICCN